MRLSARQTQALQQRIREREAELRQELAGAENRAGTVTLDQTSVGRLSRMDALQVQAMAKATVTRTQLQLEQLAGAARRLEHDPDFGLCRDCDEAIPMARLQANPAVLRCVDCAQARES